MRLLQFLLLLLSSCGVAAAAPVIAPPVKSTADVISIASAQTSTGLGAGAIDTKNGFRSMTIQVTNTGTSSTILLVQSCDGGAHWDDVVPNITSGVPDASASATVNFSVTNPQCAYSINVTAVSAASITANAYVGAHVQ